MAAHKFRLACIQLAVGKDKAANVKRALEFVQTAKSGGASVIALPECFNSPYGIEFFESYAESVPSGPTCTALSKCALDNQVYLVGGSIPERDGDKIYNTCTVWSPMGKLLGIHRKIHLFDVNIAHPEPFVFQESAVLSPGNTITTFETDNCKIGIGICYDLRFEELARLYSKEGCHLLLYPGAFSIKTGPLHWEILQRVRACDNQVFVAGIAPARVPGGYQSYAHTMVVNPWGQILASGQTDETVVYADIDVSEVHSMRAQIPVASQRRTDIYDTIYFPGKLKEV